jgi:hypothetical protein
VARARAKARPQRRPHLRVEADVTAAPQWPAGRQPRRRAAAARCAIAFVLALITVVGIVPLAGADTGPAPGSGTANASAFDAQGMWIWYISRSNGGNVAQIIARAHRARIGTVYVKAGDGSTAWSQFTSSLVSALHAGGLKVCAWQFVYGSAPYKEASVGAAARCGAARVSSGERHDPHNRDQGKHERDRAAGSHRAAPRLPAGRRLGGCGHVCFNTELRTALRSGPGPCVRHPARAIVQVCGKFASSNRHRAAAAGSPSGRLQASAGEVKCAGGSSRVKLAVTPHRLAGR